ncbi:MAG: ABC transporter ATP-binding protein [Proteobacteria bacterium]|nr:ABC transporter ATP-binding protein [Pseudomonadota bacterium]MCP4916605.1 ABC transporter ATP-binding protein [Pseudomonadota bacterium]
MSIVSVRGARREYSQGEFKVTALDGVDIDIGEGEFTVLMGPSGSGKTTLLNLIGGLDEPDSGTITVDGHELSSMTGSQKSKLRLERLGFVFQAYNLIPVLSAAENVDFVLMMQGMPPDERKKRVYETLASVGLQGMEERRPDQLSGGQQQRVAVARAIASRPALVLADEPTANLDSKTGTELVELMRDLNEKQGITFVFATHDPKVMDRARRIVRLVDGKIQADELQE